MVVILGLIALCLIGVGVVRLMRNAKVQRGTRSQFVRGSRTTMFRRRLGDVSHHTRYRRLRPVFEALGFERLDPEAFDTRNHRWRIDPCIPIEIDAETKVLGYQRPPLTIGFDHPEGNRWRPGCDIAAR